MEREIYVPFLSWLIGGVKQDKKFGKTNCYTASFGADPNLGCVGRKTFNYRVWLDRLDEDEFVMKAAIYYGTFSFEAQNEDEMEIRTFEYTEEGREMIREWIYTESEKFFSEE